MKAAHSISMTEGPLGRQILFYSLPLILSNLLQVLFNMADVAVVGRYVGASALGAVGSTTLLITLFTGLAIGMGSGVNIVVARYLGARQIRDVRESVHTSALLCLMAGFVLLTVGVGGARAILTLMNTKAELLDDAVTYLRIYFLGMPVLCLYNFGNAVLSASGDTRHPLMFLSFSGALNVLLNLFFVLRCGLGVAGVALASCLSQFVAAVLILIFLARSTASPIWLDVHALRLTPGKVRAILPLSLSSGAQNAIFALANLFVQAGVNSFDAVVVMGTAAASNADPLVYNTMASFYSACSSFMSQNYGARRRKRVLHSYYISMAYSFGAGLALGLSLLALGPRFLSLFTTEQAVVHAGMPRLMVLGLSYGFSSFMDCTIAASRGLGRSVAPTVIVILGSCVFRVIWIYTVFAYFHTIESLYLLYIFSWAITAVAEIIYFVRCYREQVAPMQEAA